MGSPTASLDLTLNDIERGTHIWGSVSQNGGELRHTSHACIAIANKYNIAYGKSDSIMA